MPNILKKNLTLSIFSFLLGMAILISFEDVYAKNKQKSMYVTATAYTDTCAGCSGVTAIGINLRKNPYKKVIAVDTNVIPLNTIVYVHGYGLAIAGDTGGAIKGRKIDVYMKSKKQAIKWGRKKVKITIQ